MKWEKKTKISARCDCLCLLLLCDSCTDELRVRASTGNEIDDKVQPTVYDNSEQSEKRKLPKIFKVI